MPHHWASYIQGYRVPICCASWSGSCARWILPCKNSRLLHLYCIIWPFGYPIRCYIWTVVLIKLIYIIKVAQLFFSFQTIMLHFESGWQALYCSFQYTHLPISVWKLNILLGVGLFSEWNLLHDRAQVTFHLRGQPHVDLLASSYIIQCQHYCTMESPLPLGAFRLNAFNHPWIYQVSYLFPPPALVPLVL